ncbi:hypothetical protein DM02DRAFT_625202 [Periconia macrospinosa]|uniref:Uncharacterized protein n=1 Tax=Periconia macrospinosa TaxID=97972 RepID=A0A2V1E1G0_9PLEO|nr:hypothetical protein DM02DRAFT_625202 [Periconia macrospinosa]
MPNQGCALFSLLSTFSSSPSRLHLLASTLLPPFSGLHSLVSTLLLRPFGLDPLPLRRLLFSCVDSRAACHPPLPKPAFSEDGQNRLPGKPGDPKSFVNKIWEGEGECAAYLGYSMVNDLRTFAMTPLVLRTFCRFEKLKGSHSLKKTLEVLQDLRNDLKTNQSPEIAYPLSHSGKDNYRVACILVQFKEEVEKAHFDNIKITEADIEAACQEFETSRLLESVPRINQNTEIRFPKFGPFPNLGEVELEAYNRLYALIRYLGHSASASNWKSRFGSSNWNHPISLGESHVPT